MMSRSIFGLRAFSLACLAAVVLAGCVEEPPDDSEGDAATGDGGDLPEVDTGVIDPEVDGGLPEIDAGFDSGMLEIDAGFDSAIPEIDSGSDTGLPEVDSGVDAGEDSGTDSGTDAGHDAGMDAGHDSGRLDDDAGSDDDAGLEDAATPDDDLEIAGPWADSWGGSHQIDNDDWIMGWTPTSPAFEISQYSNASRYVIAQNASTNAWNPGKWSRFDWTWDSSDTLWFCQTAYAADSEAAALATTAADPTDPASSGCGPFSWTSMEEGEGSIAIAGNFEDSWGGTHQIDDALWRMGWTPGSPEFAVSQHSNASRFAIAQNAGTNTFNPDKWSRFDWTWDSAGDLWYCQTAYGAESEAAALATPAANPADPANSGCGPFAWTMMVEGEGALAIEGDYEDSWGGTHQIDSAKWRMGWTPDAPEFAVSEFSNSSRYVIAQNATTNTYNPDKWSRFDWTWDADGDLWYCQTAYAADTEEDAAMTTAANPSDPASSGCGPFAWTPMTMGQGELAIEGDWVDNFTFTHTVTSSVWVQAGSSVHHVSRYDNRDRFVIAQNDSANGFAPEKWSRFDWTWDDAGELWYCQTAYDADTEDDALMTAAADPTDPGVSGCSGFAWSQLMLEP